jgi:hypothetical protein
MMDPQDGSRYVPYTYDPGHSGARAHLNTRG